MQVEQRLAVQLEQVVLEGAPHRVAGYCLRAARRARRYQLGRAFGGDLGVDHDVVRALLAVRLLELDHEHRGAAVRPGQRTHALAHDERVPVGVHVAAVAVSDRLLCSHDPARLLAARLNVVGVHDRGRLVRQQHRRRVAQGVAERRVHLDPAPVGARDRGSDRRPLEDEPRLRQLGPHAGELGAHALEVLGAPRGDREALPRFGARRLELGA